MGVRLPKTKAAAAVPVRHRLGWAAAGFAACLMLLGSLTASENAASRAQATTLPRLAAPSAVDAGPIAPPLD